MTNRRASFDQCLIAQFDIFFDRIATWNKLWYSCCL